MIKEKIKQSRSYKRVQKLYKKYERFLIPGMLVFGVVVDFITFKIIKISTAFLVLVIYLFIAAATIAYLNLFESKKFNNRALRYLRLVSPLIIQFTFGALLSASLIFYWFSGAFSISWPFIIIIAILMIANEKFRDYYLRLKVQLAILYFVLFSVFALIFPFIFNSISVWIFLLAGASSLAVIFLYLHFLSRYLDHVFWQKTNIRLIILVIFAFMNILYFLNIIPPIPLSLRDAGVYHAVVKTGNTYTVRTEETSLLQKIIPGQTIHTVPGQRVYIYSSIFAPAKLNTKIVHHWQYYDKESNSWVSKDKLSFRITGGHQDGYRGYSVKSVVPAGSWRVNVETARGQVIGRIWFKVINVDKNLEMFGLQK